MPWSEGVLSTSTTSGGSRQLVRRQAQKIRERRILYLDARGPHRLCHAPPDRQQGATGALLVALSRGAAWRSGQARAERTCTSPNTARSSSSSLTRPIGV